MREAEPMVAHTGVRPYGRRPPSRPSDDATGIWPLWLRAYLRISFVSERDGVTRLISKRLRSYFENLVECIAIHSNPEESRSGQDIDRY